LCADTAAVDSASGKTFVSTDDMKGCFTEILIGIANSGRTQALIFSRMVELITINLVGDYYLDNFQLSGYLAKLSS
jgi:hypothetical protein